MAEKDIPLEIPIPLGDALRALGDELQRAGAEGLAVDSATVELDVSVEAGADGQVAFGVVRPGAGAKRTRTTRLTVTLRAPAGSTHPAPEAQSATTSAAESATAPEAQLATAPEAQPATAPEARPASPERSPGLLDLLADALRTVSEATSRPAPGAWPRLSGSDDQGGARRPGDWS